MRYLEMLPPFRPSYALVVALIGSARVSRLIAASTSNVRLALLDQLAAEGLGYDSSLVEVRHELPRDLQGT